jgi:phosphoribosyl-ATP pyrophosphohydrolase
MDIVKFPLKNLSDDKLFERLGEECAEVIHAIFKHKRFGGVASPRTGLTGLQMIQTEVTDLRVVLRELEERGIA